MIKSTFNSEIENKHWDFPCLGVISHNSTEDGMVVLFNDSKKGMVVKGPSKQTSWQNFKIGYYCDSWLMDRFKPLKAGEQVILENSTECND